MLIFTEESVEDKKARAEEKFFAELTAVKRFKRHRQKFGIHALMRQSVMRAFRGRGL